MQQILPRLLLASSSPYRAKMLRQLGLAFETCSPNIDETAMGSESPEMIARRLSEQKARAVQDKFKEHIIIASDQVACLEGASLPIGKPHNAQNAMAQLQQYSGKTLQFYTGLCLMLPMLYAKSKRVPQVHTSVEQFNVTFRKLTESQIARYVQIEQPFDCAGSFKAEGLGICLFEKFDGRDYNTLIGLPLMALVDSLQNVGIDVLDSPLQNYAE